MEGFKELMALVWAKHICHQENVTFGMRTSRFIGLPNHKKNGLESRSYFG